MRTEKIGKDIVFKFDGFSDLGTSATLGANPEFASVRGEPKWCGGTKTVAEATGLLVDGWSKPTEEIARITERVREQVGEVVAPIIQFYNGTVGTRLDVGLFTAGDPNCFYSFYEEEGRRAERFVRVIVDNAFSSNVNADDIVTRGGAIIALCDALALSGYSTEVWVTVAVSGRDGSLYTLVPVQVAGQPWDTRSAIFPLAHPAFLRRLHFALVEGGGTDIVKRFGDPVSYGSPKGICKGDTVDTLVGGADILLSGQSGSISDIVRDPAKWVLGQLEKCGAYLPQQF
jgi:hypothetical protein